MEEELVSLCSNFPPLWKFYYIVVGPGEILLWGKLLYNIVMMKGTVDNHTQKTFIFGFLPP